MTAHLGTQAQDEAAARKFLQVPGDVSHDHRAARESHRNRGSQLHGASVFGRQDQGEKWIVLGFQGPERVETYFFEIASRLGQNLQRAWEYQSIKFQGLLRVPNRLLK